jgi:hypothetical protein
MFQRAALPTLSALPSRTEGGEAPSNSGKRSLVAPVWGTFRASSQFEIDMVAPSPIPKHTPPAATGHKPNHGGSAEESV